MLAQAPLLHRRIAQAWGGCGPDNQGVGTEAECDPASGARAVAIDLVREQAPVGWRGSYPCGESQCWVQLPLPQPALCSQAGRHAAHTRAFAGSIPARATTKRRASQLETASVLQ